MCLSFGGVLLHYVAVSNIALLILGACDPPDDMFGGYVFRGTDVHMVETCDYRDM